MNGYFWYSEKQRACVAGMNGRNHQTSFCEINGKIMEYTEWTDKPSTSGKWDDYKLLGYGKYHHSESHT